METSFDEYWERLERVGWLETIGSEERTRLREGLARHFAPRKNPFTGQSFPARTHAKVIELYQSLAPISFDAEDACEDLVALLEQLAAGSRGLFRPERIQQTSADGSARISFEHAGRTFTWTTPHLDWFDAGLLVVANDALAAANLPDRFHVLPALDQWVHIVVVPTAVFEAAQRAGLFATADE